MHSWSPLLLNKCFGRVTRGICRDTAFDCILGLYLSTITSSFRMHPTMYGNTRGINMTEYIFSISRNKKVNWRIFFNLYTCVCVAYALRKESHNGSEERWHTTRKNFLLQKFFIAKRLTLKCIKSLDRPTTRERDEFHVNTCKLWHVWISRLKTIYYQKNEKEKNTTEKVDSANIRQKLFRPLVRIFFRNTKDINYTK